MQSCRDLRICWMIVFLCLSMGCTSSRSEARGNSSHDVNGISGGKEDYDNLWRTTVKVVSNKGRCSGVLIAPKAVITAAHCFCEVTKEAFKPSSCVKRATVISIQYLYQAETKAWQPIPATSDGDVIVHTEFTSQRTSKGFIEPEKRMADLALIALDKDLNGLEPDVFLTSQDVADEAELAVIGFGPTSNRGPDAGIRRYGTNQISELTRFANERVREFRFNESGAHTHDGDSGGPALYLEGSKRWLVGINGGFTENGKQSWFTATANYYDWITSQLAEINARREP